MSYELISEAEYDGLPDPPELKFASLEQICRGSMNSLIEDRDVGQSFIETVQMQYMTTVAAAAEELEISGLFYANGDGNIWSQCADFLLQASGIVTRIKLRSAKSTNPYSVKLAAKTRGRIEQQIQAMRELVSTEVTPESRRKAILKKLDELSVELSQSRVSYAKVMSVLAHVSVVVASGTTFLADAPHAIATIACLLGTDKNAEDAEVQRLGAPPERKAISAPAESPAIPRTTSHSRMEIDDDIPF